MKYTTNFTTFNNSAVTERSRSEQSKTINYMTRNNKGGLAALLHQPPQELPTPAIGADVPIVPSVPPVPEPRPLGEPEEQITIRAPKRYLKVIDRYRLAMIMQTGNVNFSKKEAFTNIMKFFEENSPIPLPEE
jgi:hypothetical protein